MLRDIIKKSLLGEEKDAAVSEKEMMRRQLKKSLLEQLSAEMGEEMVSPIKQMPKAAVTVATSDPNKLPSALEEAKEMVSEISPVIKKIEDGVEKKLDDKKLDIDGMVEDYKSGKSSDVAVSADKKTDEDEDLMSLLKSMDEDELKKLLANLL